MIGNTTVKKQFSYNGMPCYEIESAVTNIAGIGAANVVTNDTIPSCNSLRNAAMQQAINDSAKFDPVQWIKDNKLIAGGALLAAYFLFFKK